MSKTKAGGLVVLGLLVLGGMLVVKEIPELRRYWRMKHM